MPGTQTSIAPQRTVISVLESSASCRPEASNVIAPAERRPGEPTSEKPDPSAITLTGPAPLRSSSVVPIEGGSPELMAAGLVLLEPAVADRTGDTPVPEPSDREEGRPDPHPASAALATRMSRRDRERPMRRSLNLPRPLLCGQEDAGWIAASMTRTGRHENRRRTAMPSRPGISQLRLLLEGRPRTCWIVGNISRPRRLEAPLPNPNPHRGDQLLRPSGCGREAEPDLSLHLALSLGLQAERQDAAPLGLL